MLFKHGLCHICSEFKYPFCDTQGLLTKRLEEAISSRGAQITKRVSSTLLRKGKRVQPDNRKKSTCVAHPGIG